MSHRPACLPCHPSAFRRPRGPRFALVAAAGFACLSLAARAEGPIEAGVLDLAPEDIPTEVLQSPERLQQTVQTEQAELETLDRGVLESRAEDGERAAQIALGTDFAKEATLLGFAPAAANAALADAARWYSIAASRGFPGAPSLDQAGVRFYPIRIQRERRNDS